MTFRTDTLSLLLHSIGPSKSQVLSRFKGWENWLHFLIGGVANLYCKKDEYEEEKLEVFIKSIYHKGTRTKRTEEKRTIMKFWKLERKHMSHN